MCDTIVLVGPGRVLFAKNSDRDPNEAQLLEWHPRRSHPAGASVRCTWIEIPQAPETHSVLVSRPFWMWGAEMGANEHGVVIGNEAVFTDQPYSKTGLTGMDLLRLALERASTAAGAVEVITGLMERHGQGGGCGHEKRGFTYHNSFLAADTREAFVLETAGRLWEVERVASGARSISNGLTIPGFAAAHSDFLNTRVSACRARQPFTQGRAAGAGGPADLMAILRDHGSAGPRYRLLNGAMAAPCMHAGGVATGSQTTASWVSEITPAGARHWVTATAAPCTGLFKPVAVEHPLDLGSAAGDRYDPATVWWRHKRFHRRVMRDPEAAYPTFTPERDAMEAGWLASPPEPAAAFREAEAALARWHAGLPDAPDRRPRFVRRYWAVRDRRAGLPA
jgi:dipeptidase